MAWIISGILFLIIIIQGITNHSLQKTINLKDKIITLKDKAISLKQEAINIQGDTIKSQNTVIARQDEEIVGLKLNN
jgi:hypothetical protein